MSGGNHLFDALFAPHVASTRLFIDQSIDQGEGLTYQDFLSLSTRYAASLRQRGITPGDRVAVQAKKSLAVLAVYAACVQTGAIFLPLNTAYTPAEMSYFLQDSGAALLICDPAAYQNLAPIARITQTKIVTIGEGGDFVPIASPTSPVVPRSGDDLAALLYTSGTTGRAKGAMLTHENLLSNARALVRAWDFSADDILLHALPIFHTHGLFVAVNTCLLTGCSMIFHASFDTDQVLQDLPRASVMMGVPTFYTRLLDSGRLPSLAMPSMRLFISGSAPLLAQTHRAFHAQTGHQILERYGMTETGMLTSNPYHGMRKPGAVGPPLAGVDVQISDCETNVPLGTGSIGMIKVRGAGMFVGYWGMPEKTKQDFDEAGFFITGDLGLIDNQGYVQITGRAKDVIISGGYNIYPKEIEQVLDALPNVRESAIFGAPHKDFGEAVVAVIVLHDPDSYDPDTDRQNDILSQIKDSLASFKRPRQIYFTENLPRNAMGKVQKHLLRKTYHHAFS